MTASPASERAQARSALRITLLVLLVVSGAVLLFAQPRVIAQVRAGELGSDWLLAAPGAFLLVVLAVASEAAWLAVQRRFFAGRSLLQIAFAIAFFSLVASGTWREYRARRAPSVETTEILQQLSTASDARVRAVVMEVAGHRAEPEPVLLRILESGLDDPDPLVRSAAVAAVERRADRAGGAIAHDADDDGVAGARAWIHALLPAAGDGS